MPSSKGPIERPSRIRWLVAAEAAGGGGASSTKAAIASARRTTLPPSARLRFPFLITSSPIGQLPEIVMPSSLYDPVLDVGDAGRLDHPDLLDLEVADVVEQPLAASQQHRNDRDIELV